MGMPACTQELAKIQWLQAVGRGRNGWSIADCICGSQVATYTGQNLAWRDPQSQQ